MDIFEDANFFQGTYTASASSLTFTDGLGNTYTSTFRGCDGLSTPGLFSVQEDGGSALEFVLAG